MELNKKKLIDIWKICKQAAPYSTKFTVYLCDGALHWIFVEFTKGLTLCTQGTVHGQRLTEVDKLFCVTDKREQGE